MIIVISVQAPRTTIDVELGTNVSGVVMVLVRHFCYVDAQLHHPYRLPDTQCTMRCSNLICFGS